uniref:Uncharacterized protein n=1 Tax=Triticum urartu TaxID=4572 RepID=A0A8R7K1W1_TRIUA
MCGRAWPTIKLYSTPYMACKYVCTCCHGRAKLRIQVNAKFRSQFIPTRAYGKGIHSHRTYLLSMPRGYQHCCMLPRERGGSRVSECAKRHQLSPTSSSRMSLS